jgi:hypothetical protein
VAGTLGFEKLKVLHAPFLSPKLNYGTVHSISYIRTVVATMPEHPLVNIQCCTCLFHRLQALRQEAPGVTPTELA